MRLAAIVLLIAIAAFTFACGDDDGGSATPAPTATPAASASPGESASPSAEPTDAGPTTAAPTPTPLVGACGTNPDPATPDIVEVSEPDPGDEVTSPITILGSIVAFEAQFNIALKDADGNDITATTGLSAEGQTFAPFQEQIEFTVDRETPACLWVYDISENDGSPINVLQIPLSLQP